MTDRKCMNIHSALFRSLVIAKEACMLFRAGYYPWKSSGQAKLLFRDVFKSEPGESSRMEAFLQYSQMKPGRFTAFMRAYREKSVRLIQEANPVLSLGACDPILVCHVRDDLARVRMQIVYYRWYGIKHFVYIDNMSSDGTFEFLSGCRDVSLFRTAEPYTAAVSAAWTRQIMDIYGYNRWYLCVDSDELLSYPGIEKLSIPRFAELLEGRKINVVTAFMLDMHQKGIVFSGLGHDIFSNFRYFSSAPYANVRTRTNRHIYGGFRSNIARVFLTKHPLLKMAETMLYTNDTVFPVKHNFDTGVVAVLLHYKFTPGDQERYMRIVREGTYHKGSREYKAYMHFLARNPGFSTFTDDMDFYENSESLRKIDILDLDFFSGPYAGAMRASQNGGG